MDTYDKFVIGFLILWLFFLVFAVVRIRRHRSEKKLSTRQLLVFLVQWSFPFSIEIIHWLKHHAFKIYPYSIDIIYGICAGVLIWDLVRMSDETRRKEIEEGRVPKVYNDWAKPDKL